MDVGFLEVNVNSEILRTIEDNEVYIELRLNAL
jgi:hypothetical protein